MPCVTPDGKPTSSGRKLLESLKAKTLTPEEAANIISQPLFKVRSSLRELKTAGWVEETRGKYRLTEQGTKVLD